MKAGRRRPAAAGLAHALLALGLGACALPAQPPRDPLAGVELVAEENRPLGGDSLAGRKQELRRAHRDLLHFHATIESLHNRRDRNGLVLFKDFLEGYFGEHLEPLLAGDWQSEHPEMLGIDVNVRLLQADVLMQMRSPQRMQRVIDEIGRRFAGRETMLVDYPVGEQSTLQEALRILQERKWWG